MVVILPNGHYYGDIVNFIVCMSSCKNRMRWLLRWTSHQRNILAIWWVSATLAKYLHRSSEHQCNEFAVLFLFNEIWKIFKVKQKAFIFYFTECRVCGIATAALTNLLIRCLITFAWSCQVQYSITTRKCISIFKAEPSNVSVLLFFQRPDVVAKG